MRKISILLAVLGGITLMLSGCAMMDMHGAGNHARHTGSVGLIGETLVKEFQRDPVRIIVEIPPLWAGEAAILTARIEDLSGKPSMADVSLGVAIQKLQKEAGNQPDPSPHEGWAGAAYKATQTVEHGVYTFSQIFPEEGLYQITFRMAAIQDSANTSPMLLTVTKKVAPAKAPAGDKTGKMNTVTMTILGVAFMAVMMLLMI